MTVRQALEVPGRYGFHSTRSGHAVVCLIGAILLEQNEEWAVHCARYDNGSSRAVAR
jgi:hypothetical protein